MQAVAHHLGDLFRRRPRAQHARHYRARLREDCSAVGAVHCCKYNVPTLNVWSRWKIKSLMTISTETATEVVVYYTCRLIADDCHRRVAQAQKKTNDRFLIRHNICHGILFLHYYPISSLNWSMNISTIKISVSVGKLIKFLVLSGILFVYCRIRTSWRF